MAFGAMAFPAAAQVGSPDSRPNIVVILADDLGYGDLGVQGGKDVKTPHIDRLASEGVRLTDYYANHPVCAPSRAALMTGKYQQRFGFDSNPNAAARTSSTYGVPLSEPMLPERLKSLGYATAMFGKWHIGFTPEKAPTSRGFDTFYGFLDGAMAYIPDGPTGDKTMLRGTTPEPMPAHTTEAFATEAISFIAANKDKPFFAYVAFNAVHAPLQSTKPYLEQFTHEPDPKRRTHLAMIAALDDAVGAIVDAIDRNGLGKKTLVVFTSDNGGPTWQTTSSNAPLNGVKALVLEGGIRVPAIFRWTGTLPSRKTIPSVAMEFDVTATALAVAGAASTPGLDGVNLLPLLKGAKKGDAHDQLFWRSGDQGGMRQGPWKLVTVGSATYLFDLRKDIGEHTNLAKKEPERVRAMEAAWQVWSNAMMRPQRGRTGSTEAEKRRTVAMEALVKGYVTGGAVDPKSLLYGGGPE